MAIRSLKTGTISRSALAGNALSYPGSYESIGVVPVPTAVSSVTFTSIPSTYKHLQIRYMAANDSASFQQMRFNSDSGSNYKSHYLYGNGSATGAGSATTATSMEFGDLPNSTTIYGVGIVDVLDYSSTVKNKTVRMLTGNDRNGSGLVVYSSGLWMNSSTAVSAITIYALNNYSAGSHFALYGIN